jgi:ketosteroid isomerase-like protein
MAGSDEIEIAKKLFAAWSSGDPDAPEAFLTEDAVLYDIVEGKQKAGWTAIRTFFAATLQFAPDVVLAPKAFWASDTGLAVRWEMSATAINGMFGPDNDGKTWRSEGMSTLEFRDGKVCREVDYHHGGSGLRSLNQ